MRAGVAVSGYALKSVIAAQRTPIAVAVRHRHRHAIAHAVMVGVVAARRQAVARRIGRARSVAVAIAVHPMRAIAVAFIAAGGVAIAVRVVGITAPAGLPISPDRRKVAGTAIGRALVHIIVLVMHRSS